MPAGSRWRCRCRARAAAALSDAQVVVVVNGSPITELDIAAAHQADGQRRPTSADASGGHQGADRRPAQDREGQKSTASKSAKPKSTTPSKTWRSARASRRAVRARCSSVPASPSDTVKARIRAELTWQQLIRGKFSSSLQVGEADIAQCDARAQRRQARCRLYLHALSDHVHRAAADRAKPSSRPSAARPKICAPGSTPATKAWRWRARCATSRCASRSRRSSADLPQQLRELLGKHARSAG